MQPSIDSKIPSSVAPLQPSQSDSAAVTPGQAPQQPPPPPPPPPAAAPAQAKGPPDLPEGVVIDRAQRVEYRDGRGNILNDDQVASLKGKVNFEVSITLVPHSLKDLTLCMQTRYETRTRILDAAGNELYEGPVGGNYAPPHPDVEGANPETPVVPKSEAPGLPPAVEAETDLLKEKSAEEEKKKPKPASEGNEATVA